MAHGAGRAHSLGRNEPAATGAARREGSAKVRSAILLILTVVFALAGAPAMATQDPQAAIAQARADLRAVGVGVNTTALSDAEIGARLAKLPAVQASLAAALANLNPRVADLQTRQAQWSGAPGVARGLGSLSSEVQQAHLLMLTANQLSATLADRLRENFTTRLWARTHGVFDPGLWRDAARGAPDDAARLARAFDDQAEQLAPLRNTGGSALLAAASVLAFLLLLGPGQMVLNGIGYRRAGRATDDAPLIPVALALWLVVIAAMTPLAAGLLLRFALGELDAVTDEADRLIGVLTQALMFGGFLAGLGRALLSPGRPRWRVAPLADAMVARLRPFPTVIGAVASLAFFSAGFNSVLGVSLSTRLAADCLWLIVQMAIVSLALATIGQARLAGEVVAGGADPQTTREPSRLPWILATLAAWLAMAAVLIALVTGYLALAGFLMRETLWIAAVLGVVSLLLRLADEIFPALLAPRGPMGASLETALGLNGGTLEQFGVLLSGVARLVLLLVAAVAVLAPVGASVEEIIGRFAATNFVVRLGLVSISPGAVLGGVALFATGLIITRAVRRWLELRYLPKTELDVGLRTSLATGVTYLGALIAVLVAFAYLGLSVAQIALFASALSVGIGFGLQAIIGNFVSGLILLAERPVRVGDWIAIGDLEGDVRKINVRATEIEMADRSRLIVPNSELVSKTVRNVTHAGALGRVKLVLRTDSTADPARVRDIVLSRMRAHPQVLSEPEAQVFLTDLREGALEFTALAYLASPRMAFSVKSELLFQIVPDMQAAGIALAGPGPVVKVELTGGQPPTE